MAIHGDRRLLSLSERVIACVLPDPDRLARSGKPRCRWEPNEQALSPVQDDLLLIFDLEQLRTQADDHRQAQRARNYRCMRGYPTPGERDSLDP
jgi:hypothetical protein